MMKELLCVAVRQNKLRAHVDPVFGHYLLLRTTGRIAPRVSVAGRRYVSISEQNRDVAQVDAGLMSDVWRRTLVKGANATRRRIAERLVISWRERTAVSCEQDR